MKSNNKINIIFVFSVYDLPILAPQSIIYGHIQVFMLILYEIRIFRIFNFFQPNDFILLLKTIQINQIRLGLSIGV